MNTVLVSDVQQGVLLRRVNVASVAIGTVLPFLHSACQHQVIPPFHASDFCMLHPQKAPRPICVLQALAKCNINWCSSGNFAMNVAPFDRCADASMLGRLDADATPYQAPCLLEFELCTVL